MSEHKKFDPRHLEKLNHPSRLADIPVMEIWPYLGLRSPSVIIDVGAGTGFFTIHFARLIEEGMVYACDISDVMLEWIKAHVVPHQKNIVPVKMEESSIPLEDSIADLVYMITLHHELEEPKAMLKECRRLLKAGGKILIIDWKRQAMDEGPPLAIRCRPEEVLEQLTEAGFCNMAIHDGLKKHFCITADKRD